MIIHCLEILREAHYNQDNLGGKKILVQLPGIRYFAAGIMKRFILSDGVELSQSLNCQNEGGNTKLFSVKSHATLHFLLSRI